MAFIYTVEGMTHQGRVRENNQDSYLANLSLNLFAVADGMGGHQAGEIASRLAIEIIEDEVQKMNQPPSMKALESVVQKVNQHIHKISKENPRMKGMGTTLTLLWCYEDDLYLAHVGDSRAYLLRSEGIWQITNDHSLLAEREKQGEFSETLSEDVRFRNILTRSVGFEVSAQPDLFHRKIERQERYLLCSDGLYSSLSYEEIYRLATKRSLSEAVSGLIELANARGGEDNLTGVLVQVL